MSQDYLLALCREYLDLIAQAQDPLLTRDERRYLSAQRTLAHDALIDALGPAYARPFDMVAWCREQLSAPGERGRGSDVKEQ